MSYWSSIVRRGTLKQTWLDRLIENKELWLGRRVCLRWNPAWRADRWSWTWRKADHNPGSCFWSYPGTSMREFSVRTPRGVFEVFLFRRPWRSNWES